MFRLKRVIVYLVVVLGTASLIYFCTKTYGDYAKRARERSFNGILNTGYVSAMAFYAETGTYPDNQLQTGFTPKIQGLTYKKTTNGFQWTIKSEDKIFTIDQDKKIKQIEATQKPKEEP